MCNFHQFSIANCNSHYQRVFESINPTYFGAQGTRLLTSRPLPRLATICVRNACDFGSNATMKSKAVLYFLQPIGNRHVKLNWSNDGYSYSIVRTRGYLSSMRVHPFLASTEDNRGLKLECALQKIMNKYETKWFWNMVDCPLLFV